MVVARGVHVVRTNPGAESTEGRPPHRTRKTVHTEQWLLFKTTKHSLDYLGTLALSAH